MSQSHFTFLFLAATVAMLTLSDSISAAQLFAQAVTQPLGPASNFGPPDCAMWPNLVPGYTCLPPAARTLPSSYYPSLYQAAPPLPRADKPIKSWTKPQVSSESIYAAAVRETNLKKTETYNNDVLKALTSHDQRCECVVDSPRPSGSDPSAQSDLESCKVHEVTTLPGSLQYSSHFIEAMAVDPDPNKKGQVVYGITADMSNHVVPSTRQAMYVSKSSDGGKTWAPVARVNSDYFGALDGLRNGISVGPGGHDIVITTQKGAFALSDPPQIDPKSSTSNPGGLRDAVLKPLDGPDISKDPKLVARMNEFIAHEEGQDKFNPVTEGGDAKISADGTSMIVSYGHDKFPKVIAYHKENGEWKPNKDNFADLPTSEQVLKLQYDPKDSKSIYVGSGNQAYHYNPATKRWVKVKGVDGDSAIQSMTTVGGLHIATCHGTYVPSSSPNAVIKAPLNGQIRAYSIEVDPLHHERVVVASHQGIFISTDGGKTLQKYTGETADSPGIPQCESTALVTSTKPSVAPQACQDIIARNAGRAHGPIQSDLYESEYKTAHFAPDGSVVISGSGGTFLVNPFAPQCATAQKK